MMVGASERGRVWHLALEFPDRSLAFCHSDVELVELDDSTRVLADELCERCFPDG
jgi:hypothetical protein